MNDKQAARDAGAGTRVVVMGSGGIGGYLGAKLLQAGGDVAFIARGDHFRALRRDGLRLLEEGRETRLSPVAVVESVEGLPPADFIIFAVKLPDTEAAARACLPLIGPDSLVVTFQNGVESVAMIEAVIGKGRTLGAAAYIVSTLAGPGLVEKTGRSSRLEFAEPDGRRSRRALAFESLCARAGLDARCLDDLDGLLWRKFILLSASSAMTALTRQPMGYVLSDPVAREVMVAAIRETIAVAAARGVGLPVDIEQRTIETLDTLFEKEAKASQLTDLERGKPLELEWLSGAIHRLGRLHAVPTPVHSTVTAALRPFATGAG